MNKTNQNLSYHDINWKRCQETVTKLQRCIAVAANDKDLRRAMKIGERLTVLFEARALAVRAICRNAGAKTPGIDGIIWDTPEKRMKAILELKKSNYKPKAVRRVYIPKDGTKEMRPLGIPTLKDRAMQELYAMALRPIAEVQADQHSYGYRNNRGAHDAQTYLHMLISKPLGPPTWLLDADIEKFFDNISHDWLIKNIPMDKTILRKWLKAGILELKKFSPHPPQACGGWRRRSTPRRSNFAGLSKYGSRWTDQSS